MQTAAARIGHDLKIFQTLDAQGPQTLKDLQTLTGAHPLTLGALYRPDRSFTKDLADLAVRPSAEIHGLRWVGLPDRGR